MGLRRITRRIARWLRGGGRAAQVFLGCVLGLFVGMNPGVNLLLLLGIFLLFFLNVNRVLGAICVALGKVLCLALAPVTFRIGYAIVHNMGLEGFFRWAGRAPVLALMDLEVYCVTGGLPVALAVGLLLGWILTKITMGVRARVQAAAASEKMGRISGNVFVRALAWLAFGNRKAILDSTAKPRLIRMSSLVVVVIAAVLVIGAAWLAPSYVTKDLLEEQSSAAAGAEVDIGTLDLSVLGARLNIGRLEVTDREKPMQNSFAADTLTGDIGLRGFLSERLVIDELVVKNVKTDTPRETPGRVLERGQASPSDEEPSGESVWRYFEDSEQIEKYLETVKKLKAHLERMKSLSERLPKGERDATREKRLAELAKNEGYLSLSARDLVEDSPRVVISRLTVEGIVLPDEGGTYAIVGRELSDSPAGHLRPMKIEVSEAAGLRAAAEFDFREKAQGHEISIDAPGIEVGDKIKLSSAVPVEVTDAKADVHAVGVFSADAVHIPVTIHLTDLKTRTRAGKSVLGMDPQAAKHVFDNLTEITIKLTLTGSLADPRVELDEKGLLEDLKKSLVAAGKAEVARQVDTALKDLGIELPKELPGGLKLPQGLLPGSEGEGDEEGDEEEKEDSEMKPEDLLKKIF